MLPAETLQDRPGLLDSEVLEALALNPGVLFHAENVLRNSKARWRHASACVNHACDASAAAKWT